MVAERGEGGTPPVWPRWRLIDGKRFRVRTRVPWRDVPVEYGPWGRVHDLFRRWQRNGTWQRILTRLPSLADAAGAITWDLSVDSTVCPAHRHAAGARKWDDQQKEPPCGVCTEPADHLLGRSRSEFTTRLHLAVEQGRKRLSIVITAGQRGDSPQCEPVPAKARVPRIGTGRPRVRQTKRTPLARTAPTCPAAESAAPSPTRPTRHATAKSSAPAAADRRTPTWSTTAGATRSSAGSTAPIVNRHRVVATRYDILAVRYEATVTIATINKMALILREARHEKNPVSLDTARRLACAACIGLEGVTGARFAACTRSRPSTGRSNSLPRALMWSWLATSLRSRRTSTRSWRRQPGNWQHAALGSSCRLSNGEASRPAGPGRWVCPTPRGLC
ncbi:transposase [Streptomyces hydrogenans]|uniref:transposase n=1 Tax=Streptomyces hydrogenans TaxID=1873719 RepID=UPI0037FE9DDC